MTTTTDDKAAKRTPKRLGADDLKARIEERVKSNKDYKGALPANVQWDTLEYDETMRRQFVTISTVGEDGKPDGNSRRVATSDLQHVRHTKELSDSLKRKRNNEKRAEKRKSDKK